MTFEEYRSNGEYMRAPWALVKKILRREKKSYAKKQRKLTTTEYWEQRAREYGQRAVLNLGHSEEDMSAVTRTQKEVIFPFFKQSLAGNENLVLDFGCGPGRFTRDLASIVGGYAIGVDPVQYFIRVAPESENTEYRLLQNNIINIDDAFVDVVWVCLVFGGITDEQQLCKTLSEIDRVLKKGGLLFLIENTSDKYSGDYWKFRSVEKYRNLCSFANLKHLWDYFDLGERISIMSGRKQ